MRKWKLCKEGLVSCQLLVFKVKFQSTKISTTAGVHLPKCVYSQTSVVKDFFNWIQIVWLEQLQSLYTSVLSTQEAIFLVMSFIRLIIYLRVMLDKILGTKCTSLGLGNKWVQLVINTRYSN